MGYNTHYSLVWNVHDHDRVRTCEHSDQHVKDANFCHICGLTTDLQVYLSRDNLLEIAEKVHEYLPSVFKTIWDGENMKWYEYDEDMKNLSLLMPGVLFKLDGAGEEPGDIWTNYYYEGKSQRAAKVEITVDDFDVEALS